MEPNAEGLTKAAEALNEMGRRSTEVAERFADGLAYDRDRVIAEAKFLGGQAAEAMLQFGKRLIQLKENEEHGTFVSIVENELGVNVRSAQKMMAAAAKFLSPRLASKANTYSLLGKAKLFDLAFESVEDLEELANGGTLAGHTLDEYQRMTCQEAKHALKAKDTLLAKKADAHDALVLKLEAVTKFKPKPDDIARTATQKAMLESLNEYSQSAQIALLQLATVANEVFDQFYDSGLAKHARACLEFLATDFEALATSHDIQLDMAKRLEPPAWMSPEVAKAITKHKNGG